MMLFVGRQCTWSQRIEGGSSGLGVLAQYLWPSGLIFLKKSQKKKQFGLQ